MATQTCRIACCQCGALIQPSESNLCFSCLSAETDISCDIPKMNTLVFCPKCERYLNPPAQWLHASPESPELLSLCLKRVRGLNKGVQLKNAKFIWTEPHSKRLTVEVTLRGELTGGATVEQDVPLNFVIHSQHCMDCTRRAAKDYWNACVQVRQKTEHKKTLLYLEQVLLKRQALKECTNVKQVAGGIDFFFGSRSHANAFVAYVVKSVPCRIQTSQHLKSHDAHNNTYNYKYTFSVEVAPICKNDIVCLSKAQSHRFGGIGQLCVVYKVTDRIYLIDPQTCQIRDLDSHAYFMSPFSAVFHQNQLTSFVVADVEHEKSLPTANKGASAVGAHSKNTGIRLSSRHTLVSAWVMREHQQYTAAIDSDDATEETLVHTRSHLGRMLKVGDTVLGCDLRFSNINHSDFDNIAEDKRPDVILVLKPHQSECGEMKTASNIGTCTEATMDSEGVLSDEDEFYDLQDDEELVMDAT